MKRILTLTALSTLILTLTPAAAQPNVLFISIDDLNDWVGCLRRSSDEWTGTHPAVKTPHIYALAERGVNFHNAHCQAPICNPSRVSMFLGKLPSTTGHYFLRPGFREVEATRDAVTIFQYFRRHGHFLSTRGKIFHGRADPASFDHVEPTRGWRRHESRKIRYHVEGAHPLWDWGEVDVPDAKQRDYCTAAWAAEQLPALVQRDEPFFLAVGFHLPHVPVYATEKWFHRYPLEGLEMPPAPADDLDDVPRIGIDLTINPTAPRDEWMRRTGEDVHFVRAYLAATSFVDHLVGMLLDSLEKSGAAEDTVVVLWSDHGFHLGEKGKWAKRGLWERTTRVPLILAGPDIPAGVACDQPVGLIDVWPTLNELCGLPAREGLEGHSLAPLIDDPEADWPHPALTTFGPNNHAVRTRHYRYIRYADGSEELYDHRTDPLEHTNLAGDPDSAEVVAEHRRHLPETNVDPVPGSRGSDSPLYGEAEGLHNRKRQQKKKDP